MPLSAAFMGSARVRLNYRRHQELRAWPSFEVLDDVKVESVPLPHGEVAGQILQARGGHVEDICMGPAGLAAAVWTPQSYPPWYRVVIWFASSRAMTSPQVRISGNPCWSLTGELAVTAFDGIRRGIVTIDSSNGTTRWWSRRPFSLLRLAGTPVGLLRRVVALESAVPLLAVAIVSAGLGLLVAELFLNSQLGLNLRSPGPAYYGFIAGGVLLSLGIIAATFPLLARITGPEADRSE